MNGSPTYVVGLGQFGVHVIRALQDRVDETTPNNTAHIDYMAIDSDRDSLECVSDMATVYLDSDIGLVGDNIDRYPFLPEGTLIPLEGANAMRHVGRYKLDNAVPPTFQNQEQTIRRHIETFIEKQESQLSDGTSTYTIVLVTSLGGGTGSGIFPLCSAIINRIQEQVMYDEIVLQLVGIGVLPSLNFDPEYSLPPVAPTSYVNTYAALKNLSVILEATQDTPVNIPIYSRPSSTRGESPSTGTESASGFTIQKSPFDVFWVLSQDGSTDKTHYNTNDVESIAKRIGDTIYSYTHYDALSGNHLWSETSHISPLGTFGYAQVEVPHQTLRHYCELKEEHETKEARLVEFVEPKLETLESQVKELNSALRTEIEGYPVAIDWTEQLFKQLPTVTAQNRKEVIEINQDELDAAFGVIAKSDAKLYLRSALALYWELTEGEIGQEIQSQVRQTIAQIQSRYDYTLVSNHRANLMSLSELAKTLEKRLESRKETYQQRLSQTNPSIKDLFPPSHQVFTSNTEQLQQALSEVEESLETLNTAQSQLNGLEEVKSRTKKHVREARQQLKTRLDELEREISHFAQQREEILKERDQLERELTTASESLVNPSNRGNTKTLPLDWSSLRDMTLDVYEKELTSIRAYNEYGLLSVQPSGLRAALVECYQRSRDWSDSVSQHDSTTTSNGVYEETLVLYHAENEELTKGISKKCTGPDTIHFSSNSALTYSNDPFRIEFVSISQAGTPTSLIGFQRLEEWADKGILDSLVGSYDDFRQALAYPEWYSKEVGDAF